MLGESRLTLSCIFEHRLFDAGNGRQQQQRKNNHLYEYRRPLCQRGSCAIFIFFYTFFCFMRSLYWYFYGTAFMVCVQCTPSVRYILSMARVGDTTHIFSPSALTECEIFRHRRSSHTAHTVNQCRKEIYMCFYEGNEICKFLYIPSVLRSNNKFNFSFRLIFLFSFFLSISEYEIGHWSLALISGNLADSLRKWMRYEM